MLILRNDSYIGGFSFDFITDVTIESSWDNLTDRATIVFPKNLIFKKDGEVVDNIYKDNGIFDNGGGVFLNAGYDGGIKTVGTSRRFTGFINRVVPNLPVEVHAEDWMYKLKNIKVGKYSKKGLTLNQLLTDIIPSTIRFTCDDREIGYIRIADAGTTISGVLEHLKRTQGIISYFRDEELISGFAYTTEHAQYPERRVNHLMDARVNIIDASGLEYRKQGSFNLSLKVVSIYPDNTKNEIEVGTPGGEVRTIYVYDVPLSNLKNIAEQELLKFDYEGFSGMFTTFLEPQIKHGDTVTLTDDRVTDRQGTYLVKSVQTTYGMGGGRQHIELDRIVDE